jgi:flagellar M-ring protein FliF
MKRATEGELENQIQDISGVTDATVNLAMPQQTLFLADQKQATASVLLTLDGSGFTDSAVRGVQRLVANAVTGLTPANVVITDQAGDLLSSSDGGIGDAAASKLSTESAYSRQLESGAQQIVDQMLGAGAGLVSVNARLNLDSSTQKKVTYGKTGVPLTTSTEKELLKGSAAAAAGAAGTASNVPGYATGGNSGATNYTHTKGDTTNGIDQTVTDTTVAGGTPTNLYVAISFAAPTAAAAPTTTTSTTAKTSTIAAAPVVTAKDQAAAAKAVQAYLGITQKDITSGVDTFQTSVSSIPSTTGTGGGASAFLPAGSVSKKSGGLDPLAIAQAHIRDGAAAVGGLVLLFLVRRSLKRRQALLGSAEARWMPTLAAPPIPVDDIALPPGPSPAELEAANKKALQGRVEEIAGQRPGDVAQQLRGWLAEDS